MNLPGAIGWLSHPALQVALLLLLALILFTFRWRRPGLVAACVAVAWLWVSSTPAFALWMQDGLQNAYVSRDAAAYPTADAIVILGGGTLPRGGLDWREDEARAQATRLGFGLELFRHARAETILLSGGDQALKMAHRLEEQGVPSTAVLTEDESINTHENAVNSAALLKKENLHSILLVTAGIHMPRALASFAHEGIVVIPAPPVDRSLIDSPPWWPKRKALTLTARCLREYVGMWGYRLRGWV
ncbi:uncharacterized SAM-binding protein YcdF (DUF218 family) [Luteibacter rhizovicinus]|uniref:Uncharacterized SAM-binding protein YcdF (DUF218 family) n=1 Tax=Luteibacter rhizovicinus TaxID=242606 RepID=A0A4R3Z169_9GAMM|nr:YdcF family protein [Luteibacter rhizovicinus]TCV97594.1 uncharacterized SAM-binding protein YcdF (DUF218 family) [Luteibacter rhizovicinus]